MNWASTKPLICAVLCAVTAVPNCRIVLDTWSLQETLRPPVPCPRPLPQALAARAVCALARQAPGTAHAPHLPRDCQSVGPRPSAEKEVRVRAPGVRTRLWKGMEGNQCDKPWPILLPVREAGVRPRGLELVRSGEAWGGLPVVCEWGADQGARRSGNKSVWVLLHLIFHSSLFCSCPCPCSCEPRGAAGLGAPVCQSLLDTPMTSATWPYL